VSNLLKVTLPESVSGASAVEIYSAGGEKVLSKTCSGRSLKVSVSTLPTGWYQIKVISSESNYTGNFLVK